MQETRYNIVAFMYPISTLTSIASGRVQNAQSQGYKSFIELKMLLVF